MLYIKTITFALLIGTYIFLIVFIVKFIKDDFSYVNLKGCVCMPFKKINVSETIEQKRSNDDEFKTLWDSSKMEYAIIGQLISLRKQKKISQGELAIKMKSSQQAISRIEKKEIHPSLKSICNMADSLGYELKLVPKE